MADPPENTSETASPAVEGDGNEGSSITPEDRWRPYDTPRIRHITGIRIHQLTLPESLSYASKLIHHEEEEDEGFSLSPMGEGSRPRRSSNASAISYPFPRRSLDLDQRERSSSTSTARPSPLHEPPSPTVSLHHTLPRTRVTRPRAPTLAGEVIEHGHATGSPLHASESREYDLEVQQSERKPLRCFIAMKLTRKPSEGEGIAEVERGKEQEEPRRRNKSDERDLRSVNGNNSNFNSIKRVSRTSSSNTSTNSLPNTPTKPSLRHTISSSSSNSSLSYNEQPRSRTISLTTPKRISIENGNLNNGRPSSALGHSLGRSTSRLSDTSSIHSVLRSPPASLRGPNLLSKSKASLGVSHQFAHSQNQIQFSPTNSTFSKDNNDPEGEKITGSSLEDKKDQEKVGGDAMKEDLPRSGIKKKLKIKERQKEKDIEVPFYISPIHQPSTNPRFMGLEANNDFANWLTSNEFSKDQFELEIWVELPTSDNGHRWKKLDGLGGLVNLKNLRKGPSDQVNGIEFTLSIDSKEVYHLPSTDELVVEFGSDKSEISGIGRKGIVERSLRETRMKKGVGIGGLHQLINLQAVIADTERSIEEVRRKVDRLLVHDNDMRSIRRDLSERQARVDWFHARISEVEKSTRETQARTTLKQQDIDTRRDNLQGAEEADELRRGSGRDLEDEIEKTENERLSLLPQIHSLRAHHIQTLDSLFPIQPLNPSQLLYTILNVPLPIPFGPKDPAPPLTMSEYKVDEKTTAAALGYVALIVQILGNLSGGGAGGGGLPYTITCAGSRSTVRDNTGVMQGPRSFPLYAKGVERFRYEYAVFLLNKNIEMLMQESSIRLVDLRHTLPNLKNLLLTLSSPHLPSSQIRSRVTSRNVSYRSRTPTMVNSASRGGWSRNSSTAWGSHPGLPNDDYAQGTASPRSTHSPRKVDTTLLSPSPLGHKSNHRSGNKYGNIGLSSDIGDNDDEEYYKDGFEVESSIESGFTT